MNTRLFATLGCVLPLVAVRAQANEAVLALSKKNNCAACHTADKKLVKPSWQDIGKKYAGDAGAETRLVAKAKMGGVGVWGQIPMPPNPTANEADLKAIVQYALSLKHRATVGPARPHRVAARRQGEVGHRGNHPARWRRRSLTPKVQGAACP